MATLWNKGTEALQDVARFTVGNDTNWDMRLAPYDVKGSRAHVKMLGRIGLLTKEETATLVAALEAILEDIGAGRFCIEDGVEDIHSQVELQLSRQLGDLGKKIHAGRSRNDQVLVDVKLYLKDVCRNLAQSALELFHCLQEKSEAFKDVLMPGYTHEQPAMPSSFGLWMGAYAETLIDDMYPLGAALAVCDQNPLGSAAGYGNSFPLDREETTRLLDFATLNYNSIAAQLSRGKAEKAVAVAVAAFATTLNKLAADCCLFCGVNYKFISFPDELTTGSSIMPHKKNPDVWELIRAHCNLLQDTPNRLALLLTNLTHGYHRDFQLSKDVLFPAVDTLLDCFRMSRLMLQGMKVNTAIFDDPQYDVLFTVEEVNRLVLEGMPFRDAYKKVGASLKDGTYRAKRSIDHTHLGSIGNLATEQIRSKMERAVDYLQLIS